VVSPTVKVESGAPQSFLAVAQFFRERISLVIDYYDRYTVSDGGGAEVFTDSLLPNLGSRIAAIPVSE